MPSWMLSARVMLGVLVALGRSILTECVRSGAVMMKITSSTSMTSISGIMLISAIGASAPLRWKPPKAMLGALPRGLRRFERDHRCCVVHVRARREDREEIVCETVEPREGHPVRAHERVVGENG